MKIVVTVKQVPDTNAEKTFDPATKRLNRTSIENVLNPFDEYAIEEALRIKEAIGGDTTWLRRARERRVSRQRPRVSTRRYVRSVARSAS